MLITSWLKSVQKRLKTRKRFVRRREVPLNEHFTTERLEDRTLLAAPELVSISPTFGNFVVDGTILTESPRELRFRFSPGESIEPTSLDGIQITGAGFDGTFGDGNEIPVTRGFVGIADNPEDVVFRFGETLQDDIYRIDIFGSGPNPLTNQRLPTPEPFQNGTDLSIQFEIDRGAQIVSVVPTPVLRTKQLDVLDASLLQDGDSFQLSAGSAALRFELEDAQSGDGITGDVQIDYDSAVDNEAAIATSIAAAINSATIPGVGLAMPAQAIGNRVVIEGAAFSPQVLTTTANAGAMQVSDGAIDQRKDTIVVYFNDDDLHDTFIRTGDQAPNPSVVDPSVYQLLLTNDTIRNTDDTLFNPTSVAYDPAADTAVLTFAGDLSTLAGGEGTFRLRVGNNAAVPSQPIVTALGDAGSSFNTATDLTGANGFDTGPVLVMGDGASFVDGQTFEVTDIFGGQAVVFEMEDAQNPGQQVSGSILINFDSAAPTSAAAMAAAIATAITNNTATTATVDAVDPERVNVLNDAAITPAPGFSGMTFGSRGMVISGAIVNGAGVVLDVPGADDEPGHRQIQLFQHTSHTTGKDGNSAVTTQFYNFKQQIGSVNGQTILNLITPEQMERSREILEIYSNYAGIEFVETENAGFTVATGDIRILGSTPGPGGTLGVAGSGPNSFGTIAIMDNQENWDDTFGATSDPSNKTPWFVVAMHEIGHLLGLNHAGELPPTSNLGGLLSNATLGGEPRLRFGNETEPVFPGDAALIHTNFRFRSSIKDIDLYQFRVEAGTRGVFTAETFAERQANDTRLDTLLSLYRDNGSGTPELIARNDDYFSKDSYIEVELGAGTYYIGVSSTKNDKYDPEIEDSGNGGTTQGAYDLRLNFKPVVATNIVDIDNAANVIAPPSARNTILDGDLDGNPGGEFNFWFRAAPEFDSATPNVASTLFVDKNAAPGGDGSLATPYDNLAAALLASDTRDLHDIVRVVGNSGADGDLSSVGDNVAYQIGTNGAFPLSDGFTVEVPRRVTLMIDEGAVFQLDDERIGVGSSSFLIDRSGGALQVLGTPVNNVYFTSYNDSNIGLDTNPDLTPPAPGDWGGLVFRADLDNADGRFNWEREGIFLNHVNHADMRWGGGEIRIESQDQIVNPIRLIQMRPTVSFNEITLSSDAAISATPDSFLDETFHTLQYQLAGSFTSDIQRIGPDIDSNRITGNSFNGLFLEIETPAGNAVRRLTVPGRFDDTDITHIVTENLIINGRPGGPLRDVFQPPTTLVTLATNANATANFPGVYDYRITFVDVNGIEGPPSAATLTNVAVAAGQEVVVSNLPQVNGEYVARRIYRSANGGGGPYTLVRQFNGTDLSFTDDGSAVGGTLALDTFRDRARLDARLAIDPGTVVKLDGSRFEAFFGGNFIAEGLENDEIIFTSLQDDRFGRNGTFDTNNNLLGSAPTAGNWGGIFIGHTGSGSIDRALITFAGGNTSIEGEVVSFNPIEVHQADFRISNSVLENNADGTGGTSALFRERLGRGRNDSATIFVRGSQPVILDNIIQHNNGPAINVDVNSLNHLYVQDTGRVTGLIERVPDYDDNQGPLISGNRMLNNDTNGMNVRPGTLATQVVWDDTDIVHVLMGEIVVPDFHTFGGIRLESSPTASLVVKSLGGRAGFTATGRPLDIDDRIGGSVQIIGQPGFPVVLTSLLDDTVGASLDPDGFPHLDTNNDGISDPGNGSGSTIPPGPPGPIDVLNTTTDANTLRDALLGSGITPIGNATLVSGANSAGLFTSGTQAISMESGIILSSGHAQVAEPGFLSAEDASLQGDADLDAEFSVTTTDVTSLEFDFQTDSGELFFNFVFASDEYNTFVGEFNDAFGLFLDGVNIALVPGTTTPVSINNVNAGNPANGTPPTNDQFYHNNEGPTAEVPNEFGYNGFTDVFTATATGLSPGVHTIKMVVGDVIDTVVDTAVFIEAGTFSDSISSGGAGDWRSVKLDQFSHDRNVEIVVENEDSSEPAPGTNALPNTSQFIGTLAAGEKATDDNLRLGFEIQGYLNEPSDVDVYSFEADAGTEVWFDIDRTTHSLDTVVELIGSNQSILVQSDNSHFESTDPANFPLFVSSPTIEASILQKSPLNFLPDNIDQWTTNPRDAGFRVVLPGPQGTRNNYLVRVRSSNLEVRAEDTTANRSDLQDVTKIGDGLTSGLYQLGIRLGEKDEFPGSTVQFADIRFATNGIEILGLPVHSPLLGEAQEPPVVVVGGTRTESLPNNTFGTAIDLGNLLNSDRATLSVAGQLLNAGDVDFFGFDVAYDSVQSNGDWLATTFDIDYADGLGRPDSTLAIFHMPSGAGAVPELVYVGRDSNINDDRSGPLEASGDLDDLDRGTVGALDPFIGSLELPEGSYFAAVTTNDQIAADLRQYYDANPANPNVRLEPVNQSVRIVEDHISGGFNANIPGSPIVPTFLDDNSIVPFSLNDVTLFVSHDRNGDSTIRTIDPLTGQQETNLGADDFRIRDLVMRPDGELFSFTWANGAGQLDDTNVAWIRIDTGTAADTVVGTTNIMTYRDDPAAGGFNLVQHDVGMSFEGLAINFTPTLTSSSITPNFNGFAIGNRNDAANAAFVQDRFNVLYRFNHATGASNTAGRRADDARINGAGTDILEEGVLDTRLNQGELIRGIAIVPGNGMFYAGDGGGLYRTNVGSVNVNDFNRVANNEWQELRLTGRPTGGTFTLNYRGQDTAALDFDATETEIETALNALTTLVSNEYQRFEFTNAPTGGTFSITLPGAAGGTTAAIPFNASATAIENALVAGIPAISAGDVTVHGGLQNVGSLLPGVTFDVEFRNVLQGVNIQQMVINDVLLIGHGGVTESTPRPGGQQIAVSVTGGFDTGNVVRIEFPDNTDFPLITSDAGLLTGGVTPDVLTATIHNGGLTDLPGSTAIPFSGLTNGPEHVQNQAYRNLLFGVSNDGYLYAFDTTGTLQPIFEDFQTYVPILNGAGNRITGLTGLDFSTLERNLWHRTTTSTRNTDTGHGINAPHDASRISRTGGQSFYFGNENQGVDAGNKNSSNNFTTYNNSRNLNYDFPGGAHGSLQSATFSLEGYHREDKPVLYFNYLLDTDNGQHSITDSRVDMTDSFRVLISGDDGVWQLLATNNSERDGDLTDGDDEYSDLSGNANPQDLVQVQELFDSGNWRQARVPLDNFAGQKNLKLRFDFATSGDINLGDIAVVGEELRSIPGADLRDNNRTFTIDTDTFEFDLGFTIVTPVGARLQDGDTITIDPTPDIPGDDVVVEFDDLAVNDGIGGDIEVNFSATDTANDVAQSLFAALATFERYLPAGSDRVNLPAVADVTSSTADVVVEGTYGVGAGNIRVPVHAGLPRTGGADSVTSRIRQALAEQYTRGDQSLITSYHEVNIVINRSVVDPGPLGLTNTLQGDQFGNFYDSDGDDTNGADRGIDNNHEGVYVDDIIIGFAERGEMVTGANQSANFADNVDIYKLPGQVDEGEYQLEIRRSVQFGAMNMAPPPALALFNSFDTNDRHTQAVTLTAPSGHEVFEGQTFVLSDGVSTLTFEFDDSAINDGVAGGNVEIPFDSTNWDMHDMAVAIRNAINSSQVQLVLDITAQLSDGRVAGSAGSAYRVNLVGNAVSDILANTDFSNEILFDVHNRYGDQNHFRDQGMTVIRGNSIRSVSEYGIAVDVGNDADRVALVPQSGNLPHNGPVRNLEELNTENLAPGVVLVNNLIVAGELGGIHFKGDSATGASQVGPVPFGRIVNNTVFGTRSGDVGILVEDNTSPTLINNLLTNLDTAISVDLSSGTTVITGNFFQDNVLNGNINGTTFADGNATPAPGSFFLLGQPGDPLFVDAAAHNYYLADGALPIDSSIDSINDRQAMTDLRDPLEIAPSPIVAPELDAFGQKRVDDPTQTPPPGLGSNVFKDRGAIERADFVGPEAFIINPLDNAFNDLDVTLNNVKAVINPALFTQFVVRLTDNAIGVDDSFIFSSQFVLMQNGTPLVDGTDYIWKYNANTNEVFFTSVSAFQLDMSYTVSVDNDPGSGVRDRAGNLLMANRPGPAGDPNGIVRFDIILLDDNNPPQHLIDGEPDFAAHPQTILEGTTLNFSVANGNELSIEDSDVRFGTGEVEVTLTASTGTLTLADPSNVTFSVGTGTGDTTMTFRADIDVVLTTINDLTWTPPSTIFNGDATIDLLTSDLGNEPGTPLTDFDTIAITVLPVNNPPVNMYNNTDVFPVNAVSTDEDVPLVFSAANNNQIQVTDVDTAEGTGEVQVTLSLLPGTGTLTLGGIGGLGFPVGTGIGDESMTFVGLLSDINNALSTLTYTPPPDFQLGTTLTITTNDLGQFPPPAGIDTDTIDITINPLNDAPEFNIPSVAPNSWEDSGPRVEPGFATNMRPGPVTATTEASQQLTFFLTVTSGAFLFSDPPDIDEITGDLTYRAAPDAWGTATVEVILKDDGLGTGANVNTSQEQIFTITIDQVPNPAVISGQKFNDLNGDGVRQPTEPYLNGWTIELYNDLGLLVESQVTRNIDLDNSNSIEPDEMGWYVFDQVAPVRHTVHEVLPNSDWMQTLPGSPDFYTVDPINQGATFNLDFGNFEPADVTGRKFHDINGNAFRDAGEPYLNGWTIQLLDAAGAPVLDGSGNAIQAVTADIDLDNDGTIDPDTERGHYQLLNLIPGDYLFREVLPAGWASSLPGGNPAQHSITLNGGDVRTLDFGNYNPVTITVRKYRDDDASGSHDPGEAWLSGWTIELVDSSGGIVALQTGDVDLDGNNIIDPSTETGVAQFTGVVPGIYTVREVLQTGWIRSEPVANYNITVVSGDVVGPLPFGNYQQVEIHGRKFNDFDRDGIRDAGEPWLNGWTVELLDGQNNVIATAVTHDVDLDNNGSIDPETERGWYWFTGLDPDPYAVREVQQTNWIQSAPAFGTYSATLISGQTIANWNFGNYETPSDIHGRKYEDLNANGTRDAGEPWLDGWTVELLDLSGNAVIDVATGNAYVSRTMSMDLNNDGSIDPETETGWYWFNQVIPGDYLVRETQQAGWVAGAPANGQHTIQLPAATVIDDLDFGNYRAARLSGRKFHDIDGDQVRDPGEDWLNGWTIELRDAQGNVVRTVVTADVDLDNNGSINPNTERGWYSFDGVKPGDYTVAEVMQQGYGQSLPGPATNNVYTVALVSNQDLQGVDFGNYLPVTLRGRKFEDVNANEFFDPGEPVLDGWTIELYDGQNTLITSQVTGPVDVNGNGNIEPGEQIGWYEFANLPPGDYTIREQVRAGWVQTLPTRDQPIPNAYGLSALSGQVISGLAFGNYVPAVITGQKFHDLNANGTRDAGEPGLDGWTIELVDSQNNVTQVVTAQVDLDNSGTIDLITETGLYTFAGLVPGDYTVREVQQTGWIQSHPATGTYSLSLVSQDAPAGIDFGNYQTVRVEARKLLDVDADGSVAGDPGLNGWTIELVDTANNVVATAVTQDLDIDGSGTINTATERGWVRFDNVTPGDYTLREVPRAGWIPSVPATGEYSITLISGQAFPPSLFANHQQAEIRGQKFHDLNANGQRDVGEESLNGWTIELLDAQNNVVSTVVTADVDLDNDGTINAITERGVYRFIGLDPGDYTVREVVSSGWVLSAPAGGQYAVNLTSGELESSLDFGNYFPGVITGRKFHDLDADGTFDAGEPWLNGWTFELLDAQNNVIDTVVTGDVDLDNSGTIDPATESGWFNFTGVVPGGYQVLEVARANWIVSTPGGALRPVQFVSQGNIPQLTFGNYVPVSIHGRKFLDSDTDGVRDPGEQYLNGWTFQLLNNLGQVVGAEITANMDLNNDGNIDPETERGWYWFNDLTPGTYTVREVQQPGWSPSQPANGQATVTLISNNDIDDLDFGNFVHASFTGRKYHDINTNGQRDAGEEYLNGWTIQAVDGAGNVVGTGVTMDVDLNGNGAIDPETERGIYQIIGIAPGTYTLREIVTAGWVQSTPDHTGVTVGSGQVASDLDFGNYSLSEISGRVFNDLDADGIQEPGDLWVNGRTIELLDDQNNVIATDVTRDIDLNNDGQIDPATETGRYLFTDVDPGSYSVREIPPATYFISVPVAGAHTLTVVSGQPLPVLLFGEYQNGQVEGRKFHDLNSNGLRDAGEDWLAGWSFELLNSQGAVIATVVTGDLDRDNDGTIDPNTETGWYRFTGVRPGGYTVREVLQAGWTASVPTNGIYNVAVFSGQTTPPTLVGNFQSTQISGRKFHDLNADGIRQSGEEYLNGWLIQLVNSSGSVIATSSTADVDLDNNGSIDPATERGIYSFSGVTPGDYTVREVAQAGWIQSTPGGGGHAITLTSSANQTNLLFGNFQPASIHGRKFSDVNANGVRDAGEPWLNGWTIELRDPSGNVVGTAVTMNSDLDGNGFIDPETERGWYWLEDVIPGSYELREVQQAGWGQSAPEFDSLSLDAFNIDQTWQLVTDGNYFENWGGQGERWLNSVGNGWFYILPNGELYQWDRASGPGGAALNGTLIHSFSTRYFDNPLLLAEPDSPLITVTSGQALDGHDFGNFELSTIHGQKWDDQNGDGIRDPNEPGLNGFTINLLDENGNVVDSTTTMDMDLDNNGTINPLTERGLYWFLDVVPGNYFLEEVELPGWKQTAPNFDPASALAWQVDQQFDLRLTGSLFENWGGLGERWVNSAGHGWFYITPQGDLYQWDDGTGVGGTGLSGTLIASLSPQYFNDPQLLTDPPNPFLFVGGSQAVAGFDFGNVRASEIHGQKFNDLDGNGIRSANEPGLNGWTIQLLDAGGNVIATTTTMDYDVNNDGVIDPISESGWYWFQDLAPGSYAVQEIGQSGWTPTTPQFAEGALEVFLLDQDLGFTATTNQFEDWGGLNELWFRDGDGFWHYITPDGTIYEWDRVSGRTTLNGTVVAQVDPIFRQDLSRVTDAIDPRLTLGGNEVRNNVHIGNAQAQTFDQVFSSLGELLD